MEETDGGLVFDFAAFVCGLCILERGADKFVDSSAVVAKRLGVSPTLVGLLTCGAEWEELVVILAAIGQHQSPLAMGNLVGSNIANSLGSFPLGLLFAGGHMKFDQSSRIYTAISLGLTSAFLLLSYTLPSGLRWLGGVVLLVAFAIYLASVTWLICRGALVAPEDDSDYSDSEPDSGSASGSDGGDDSKMLRDAGDGVGDAGEAIESASGSSSGSLIRGPRCIAANTRRVRKFALSRNRPRPDPLRKHVLGVLLGLVLMLISGYVIARSARTIGGRLGLSDSVIGATIVSLATTIPDKIVALKSGWRHQPGILVANTVGSNIFLMLCGGGILFIWSGGDAGGEQMSLTEALVMWASASLLLVVVLAGGRRWTGLLLCIGYLAFLGVELMNGRRQDNV